MSAPIRARVRALREVLPDASIDALWVSDPANVRYLAGRDGGSNAAILVTRTHQFFITDGRYIQEARERLGKLFSVILSRGPLVDALGPLRGKERIRTLGFEAGHLTYRAALRLRREAGPARVKPTAGLVLNLRAVKTPDEIRAIRRAAQITERVLTRALRSARRDMTETALARRLVIDYLRAGAESSFTPIVAAGPNSAKPHARAGARRLGQNSFCMVDTGARLGGYCADMTRMAITGTAPRRFRKIYTIVRAAQELAIARIRPGAAIADIDRAARAHIALHGFGRCFTHALGHGIGLEVHEEPRITPKSRALLRTGMVFSVEPAIYLPGFGGVRIEDMVLVTARGHEILTGGTHVH